MSRRTSLLVAALILAAGSIAHAERLHLYLDDGTGGAQHGLPVDAGKALGDTVYLLGNPRNPDHYTGGGLGPQHNGTFEDEFGNPGWYGWTSHDYTYSSDAYWHVSDFNAVSGSWSMWCGTYFDGDPGYGNSWNQNLVFVHQVADPAAASTVQLAVTIQNDTEPGYDYTYVEYLLDGVWTAWNPEGYDGTQLVLFAESVTYEPGDYAGDGADEIQLRIRFNSDGAWSDEDGLWDTNGACQVDDITVRVNGAVVNTEDFEDGPGGSYAWQQMIDPGVGDFAALYTDLREIDLCRENRSAQVAFIDDGVVVPGTGGSPCTTWCYGPGGWIVNNTGGLMGPDFHLANYVLSPPLEWPAGAVGAELRFSAYRHEELGAFSVWPGMFYRWDVRSTATGDPADLELDGWHDRSFVQYGGPDYIYQREWVADLLVPGRTHAQVRLGVHEYGYVWGWVGTDGTPAPYFDNVAFVAYPFAGPGIAGRSIDWFNDNFPASGDLDYADLASNAVRLDCAQNIAQQDDLVNYPGDSIWFDVSAIRPGSALVGNPTMHLRLQANPLFDGVRVLPPNFTQNGDVIEGWVAGDSTFNANGGYLADRYNFDLPDDDFFYPGDVLRYYIRAEDTLGGVTLLPGDTTGFASTAYDLRYPDDFIVRALPTMFSATPGDQPRILFWQDAIDRGGQDEWFHAFGQTGYRMGVDYDMYATNGPSSGVGNGLGGRASSAQLAGYEALVYTSSYLAVNLLANGDFENDPSNDLQVVGNWLAQGDELNPKTAFMTGDNLVSGLLSAGSQGQTFVNSYFNVNLVAMDVRDLVGNQVAPRVAAIEGNGLIPRVETWIASGGCPRVNTFDAVEVNAGTARLAEFTDPGGNPGVYPYAAASYYQNPTEFARVILMPYDLMYLHNDPDWTPPAGYDGVPARAIILEDVLNVLGPSGGTPIGVGDTPAAVPTVSCFPNPFNPRVTVRLDLPRPTAVDVKIFDLRGRLVRTLAAGELAAGRHDLVWDGKTDHGAGAASGVYFCETHAAGEVLVDKLTLVR